MPDLLRAPEADALSFPPQQSSDESEGEAHAQSRVAPHLCHQYSLYLGLVTRPLPLRQARLADHMPGSAPEDAALRT